MANITALNKIKDKLNRTYGFKFYDMIFKCKILTQKDEQAIIDIVTESNLNSFSFASRLQTLSLAFSVLEIDGAPVYAESDNKPDYSDKDGTYTPIKSSRLSVTETFESWDADILALLFAEQKKYRTLEKQKIATQLGISKENLAEFEKASKSTIDSLTDTSDIGEPVPDPKPEATEAQPKPAS